MYQQILVPVDGSITSNRGLQEAIRIAQLTHGRIRLVHVIDELSFAIQLDSYGGYSGDFLESLYTVGAGILEAAKEMVTAAGIESDVVLHDNLSGPVHSQVIAEAEKWPADLIVLGTHGRRGVSRLWLGSSAEKILRTTPVPVLLVRAPEVQAPDELLATQAAV